MNSLLVLTTKRMLIHLLGGTSTVPKYSLAARRCSLGEVFVAFQHLCQLWCLPSLYVNGFSLSRVSGRTIKFADTTYILFLSLNTYLKRSHLNTESKYNLIRNPGHTILEYLLYGCLSQKWLLVGLIAEHSYQGRKKTPLYVEFLYWSLYLSIH